MDHHPLRLIATLLPPDNPSALSWARRSCRRPRSRWAIRISADGHLGVVAGWEQATFGSYALAVLAIKYIEAGGGSYISWLTKRKEGSTLAGRSGGV